MKNMVYILLVSLLRPRWRLEWWPPTPHPILNLPFPWPAPSFSMSIKIRLENPWPYIIQSHYCKSGQVRNAFFFSHFIFHESHLFAKLKTCEKHIVWHMVYVDSFYYQTEWKQGSEILPPPLLPMEHILWTTLFPEQLTSSRHWQNSDLYACSNSSLQWVYCLLCQRYSFQNCE